MIPTKQLSLAGLVWFSLASQGLALEIDQNSKDLNLVQRDPLSSGSLKVALAPGQKLPKVPRDMKVALAPNQRMPKVKHHRHPKRDEEELEIRQPILPHGNHRSRFGGRMSRGGHRLRDIKERDLDLEPREPKTFHGGHRAGRRHGPRDVDELDGRDLEERKISAKGVAKALGRLLRGPWASSSAILMSVTSTSRSLKPDPQSFCPESTFITRLATGHGPLQFADASPVIFARREISRPELAATEEAVVTEGIQGSEK
uniref:Uncharacterized protein n=1 Tax=Bionectria ochroleuca TaxID=29856 RepID=A0A8H7KB05_BIOOC